MSDPMDPSKEGKYVFEKHLVQEQKISTSGKANLSYKLVDRKEDGQFSIQILMDEERSKNAPEGNFNGRTVMEITFNDGGGSNYTKISYEQAIKQIHALGLIFAQNVENTNDTQSIIAATDKIFGDKTANKVDLSFGDTQAKGILNESNYLSYLLKPFRSASQKKSSVVCIGVIERGKDNQISGGRHKLIEVDFGKGLVTQRENKPELIGQMYTENQLLKKTASIAQNLLGDLHSQADELQKMVGNAISYQYADEDDEKGIEITGGKKGLEISGGKKGLEISGGKKKPNAGEMSIRKATSHHEPIDISGGNKNGPVRMDEIDPSTLSDDEMSINKAGASSSSAALTPNKRRIEFHKQAIQELMQQYKSTAYPQLSENDPYGKYENPDEFMKGILESREGNLQDIYLKVKAHLNTINKLSGKTIEEPPKHPSFATIEDLAKPSPKVTKEMEQLAIIKEKYEKAMELQNRLENLKKSPEENKDTEIDNLNIELNKIMEELKNIKAPEFNPKDLSEFTGEQRFIQGMEKIQCTLNVAYELAEQSEEKAKSSWLSFLTGSETPALSKKGAQIHKEYKALEKEKEQLRVNINQAKQGLEKIEKDLDDSSLTEEGIKKKCNEASNIISKLYGEAYVSKGNKGKNKAPWLSGNYQKSIEDKVKKHLANVSTAKELKAAIESVKEEIEKDFESVVLPGLLEQMMEKSTQLSTHLANHQAFKKLHEPGPSAKFNVHVDRWVGKLEQELSDTDPDE